MTAPTSCPACAAPLAAEPALRGADRLHGTPGTFDVVVCRACGSGRTLPLLCSEDLAPLYPDEYNAYALPANPLLRATATGLYRWRYRRALGHPPLATLRKLRPGRLLDVGSGRGDLGVVLSKTGWDVTGVEPSASASAEARSRGVATESGTLATSADRVRGGYDVVVFQHSLEHVIEPSDDLAVARRLLRDGGYLLVSVPNFGSWQRRRFAADWFHLDLPRHRSHFSRRGLELLLARAGFSPIIVATSTTADGLPMSVQYRVFGERRFKRGFGQYATVALALALVPVTVALDAIAGEGDVLHAVAVKAATGGEATER